jgi:hypothetical protein
MNIAIGKFGRSIYFDKARRSMTSGDEEAPMLYTLLAQRYPEHTFYLIGKSDASRLRARANAAKSEPSLSSFFDDTPDTPDADLVDDIIPKNIVDLFEDIPANRSDDPHFWLLEKIQRLDLKFDCGIIYHGPVPGVGIPGVGIMRVDGKSEAQTLMMFSKYYACVIHTLNVLQIPWIGLCGDPKYVPMVQRDFLNEPKIILSQISKTFPARKRIVSYDDSLSFKTVEEKYVYSAIETVYMLDEKKVDWRNIKKDIRFTIGLNGGFSRDDFMREWFINHGRTDVKVYGVWSEEFTSAHPNMFEEKRISDVADIFFRTRYTIIPPPHKPTGNFVTQKFWKTIQYGIIPFFHPKYDTDKIFPVPEILRIKNAAEMYERMDYLDNHHEETAKIHTLLWNLLDDRFFNGDHLDATIKNALKKYANISL